MYLTRGIDMPFMMQAWWLFVLCTLIYFIVSYSSPRPPKEIIENYTWDSPLAVIARGEFKGFRDPRFWAGILVATLLILYMIF